jgi:lipoteichoic acid synthase
MHFFDEALERFTTALKNDGLLDDAVLMVFGDHDAGFAHDTTIASAIGLQPTDAAWALADKIPWFLRVPRLGGAQTVDARPTGQTDFAPTLLALLGIDAAPLPYMGRNMLGAPDDPPIPRPYGDWLDRSHLFLAEQSSSRGRTCFALDRGLFVDERECAGPDARAKAARDVSRLVVADDLQERVRAKLFQLVQ